MSRVYLSPPHLTGRELERVRAALDSNWVAPAGPELEAFEAEVAERTGVAHAAALSSGTAALHLAIKLLGVGPGDEVLCPTLTFAATANAIVYEGAVPVFLDVDRATWNLDPALLAEELERAEGRGELPKAVIAVDLYGQSADYEAIESLCERHGVAVIEDAAEALGATYRGRPVGGFGTFGVFSFNGNKIITTSGGGMLVSNDGEAIARARHLATQARDAAPHYEHSTVGYNYRLSNVLAALGRAQLETLDERVEAKRGLFARYVEALGDLPGIAFMPETAYGRSTRWLTCITLDPQATAVTPERIWRALEDEDIEARPLWKPMHRQPVFAGLRTIGGEVAEGLFATGLCLPSGCGLNDSDFDRIVGIVRGLWQS